jgi:hypothetical protein
MAQATLSTLTVKDSTATTKTMSKVTDPNNSSYLVPKVMVDESLITKGTYSAGALLLALPATPTDVIQIKGSATKTVRIKKITLSGKATTAGNLPVALIRRAAAVSDGTPATPAIVRYDTSDAAPTAVVTSYVGGLPTPAAANPASSVVAVGQLEFPLVTTAGTGQPGLVFNFAQNADKAFILRGVADCLVVNFNGATLNGGEALSYSVEWEEDAS